MDATFPEPLVLQRRRLAQQAKGGLGAERAHDRDSSDFTDESPSSSSQSTLFPGFAPLQIQPLRLQTDFATSETTSAPLAGPRNARSQSIAATAVAPIRRKPLSATASQLATAHVGRQSTISSHDLSEQASRTSHAFPGDSPTLHEFPEQDQRQSSSSSLVANTMLQSPNTNHDVDSDKLPVSPTVVEAAVKDALQDIGRNNIPDRNPATLKTERPAALTPHEYLTSHTTASGPQEGPASFHNLRHSVSSTSDATPLAQFDFFPSNQGFTPQQQESHTPSTTDITPYTFEALSTTPPESPIDSPKPPTLFSWDPLSPSVTEPSTRHRSPLHSPLIQKESVLPDATTAIKGEVLGLESSTQSVHTSTEHKSSLAVPSSTLPAVSFHPQIEEMEDELKAISAELASSIRREMDLEDLVDKLQAEVNNPSAGKRNSDYFSDSGYSSAKFSEFDHAKEEISQIQRRAEQEKAQIRLDLTRKLQHERSLRQGLDQQIKDLAHKASKASEAHLISKDADARVKDLEKSCGDLRRRLSEEQMFKSNLEDLFGALKDELQTISSERDNLRDEVVPQLRSRVEGLEVQAVEHEKLTYETTKMQQELQSLRETKAQNDFVSHMRSSSKTGGDFHLGKPPLGIGKTATIESASREVLADRLKDVEAQRDALHNALKSLLERQEYQNRENDKKIKMLEDERERLMSASPKRAGFEKEVTSLRKETGVLRRRAEEALEQKWQVEKSMIGLKSQLEQAEEEISSLRGMLRDRDILSSDASISSANLEKAFEDLQVSHRKALDRVTALEASSAGNVVSEKTRLAMQKLEQSLAIASHDRDDALRQLSTSNEELTSLQSAQTHYVQSEQELAEQLQTSSKRIEDLAQQVRQQLTANATLRARLADTVSRGENGQKASKHRLENLQTRIRTLEEQVLVAQSAAEERVTKHESEIASLREAHNLQLARFTETGSQRGRSPRVLSTRPPASPSPMLLTPSASRFPPRMLSSSPHRDSNRSASPAGSDRLASAEELAQLETFKTRVAELEKALIVADCEMQEVVGRMSEAQIEVMNLRVEREQAVRDTKKLQKLLEAEKLKGFAERFNTINSMVTK